jgi:DNA-directed RNA polymerase subunit RPC12/RpoP
MAKRKGEEKKPVTEESTAMGETLQKAGFVPPAGDVPETLMTYEVVFSYEASSGKRYHQSSIVSECRNAADAQQTVRDEIQKRGLDVEKIDITETLERPDLLKEVAVEATLPGETAEMFPVPASEIEDPPAHRSVNFHAKIVDVNVKQGDTRLLKIVMLVGSDIARVSSELMAKFQSSEMLLVTVEPLQLTTNDIKKHKSNPVSVATKVMAEAAPAAAPEMVKYVCPHCQAENEIDKNNHPADWACVKCGKIFPIEFTPADDGEDDPEDDLAPEGEAKP